MAFQTKTDYSGLTSLIGSSLVIRDDNPNDSVETYFPQGQDGSFVAGEVYGQDSAPTNTFGLKANLVHTEGTIKLGKVTSIGDGSSAKKYKLESIEITTGSATPVGFSVTSQEVESGATDDCVYDVPAFAVTTKQHAQDIFSALTLNGSGCEFTQLTARIACSVNKDKVAGMKISSDINSGVIEITGTILQTGTTDPTLAVAEGWVISQPPTAPTPETAYKTWSFTVRKNLKKSTVSAS